MRKRAMGGVAALASVAVVAGAGSVLAGESDQGPGQDRDVEVRTVTAERVGAPVAARAVATKAAAQKPRKKRKPELIYLETPPQTIAAGPTGFRVAKCPKRSSAINGYYYVGGTSGSVGLDNQGDHPVQGLRRWGFYLDSPAGVSGVTFGLICVKNVPVR